MTQLTFDAILLTPAPATRPVQVIKDEAPEVVVLDPREAKRVNPYSAPTYEKFQAAFRSKYARMPRAPEITHWYEEHPGEWAKRHGDKGTKR